MSNTKYEVGDVVKLKTPCLGNEAGAIGYVFHTYQLVENDNGIQVIFINGNYDGFSEHEQEEFLERLGPTTLDYNFKNVIKVNEDYNDGYFIEAFNVAYKLNNP